MGRNSIKSLLGKCCHLLIYLSFMSVNKTQRRPKAVLTHLLGVAYVASAPLGFVDVVWIPLVFRSCGLDSVAIGFVEIFWILVGKDVSLRASRPARWVSARHYVRCGGSGPPSGLGLQCI